MALKCYFQQLLSYKYLLFFFSSFPPGEKGRGPIENSALSLSVGFKYRSNNRSLLLFFLKFPVVLLAGSAAERNQRAALFLQMLSECLCGCVCVRVCVRSAIGWGVWVCVHACVCVHLCAYDSKRSFLFKFSPRTRGGKKQKIIKEEKLTAGEGIVNPYGLAHLAFHPAAPRAPAKAAESFYDYNSKKGKKTQKEEVGKNQTRRRRRKKQKKRERELNH